MMAELKQKAPTTNTAPRPSRSTNDRTRSRSSNEQQQQQQQPDEAPAEDNQQSSNKRARRQRKTKSQSQPLPAKELGFFIADPSKPHPTPADMFSNLGLSKKHCFQFHCVGQECANTECDLDHTPLLRVNKEDRDKILNNMVSKRHCFLNPALKKNPRFMGVLSDEQKTLFPVEATEPAPGASD